MKVLQTLLGAFAFWIFTAAAAMADVAPPEPGVGGDPATVSTMVPVMGGLVAIGLGTVVFLWMQKNKAAKS